MGSRMHTMRQSRTNALTVDRQHHPSNYWGRGAGTTAAPTAVADIESDDVYTESKQLEREALHCCLNNARKRPQATKEERGGEAAWM